MSTEMIAMTTNNSINVKPVLGNFTGFDLRETNRFITHLSVIDVFFKTQTRKNWELNNSLKLRFCKVRSVYQFFLRICIEDEIDFVVFHGKLRFDAGSDRELTSVIRMSNRGCPVAMSSRDFIEEEEIVRNASYLCKDGGLTNVNVVVDFAAASDL